METSNDLEISVLNGHAHCLLCGHHNPASWGLCFHHGEGTSVHAALPPSAGLQGYEGVLHGGVLCALLDAAMTHCLFHRGVRAFTADLHVRFLEPVSSAEGVRVRAWIVAEHSPLYRLASEIVQGDRVMARGEARFMKRRALAADRHSEGRRAGD